MAKSKRVTKALKLRKQVKTAQQNLNTLQCKLSNAVAELPRNEQYEYNDRIHAEDNPQEGDEDDA